MEVGAAESSEPNDLYWSPRESFTVLLHEIGHHRLTGHTAPTRGLDQLVDEALAWVWAEWAASEENLWFNYRAAEKYFATYVEAYRKETGRKFPFTIQWHKKEDE